MTGLTLPLVSAAGPAQAPHPITRQRDALAARPNDDIATAALVFGGRNAAAKLADRACPGRLFDVADRIDAGSLAAYDPIGRGFRVGPSLSLADLQLWLDLHRDGGRTSALRPASALAVNPAKAPWAARAAAPQAALLNPDMTGAAEPRTEAAATAFSRFVAKDDNGALSEALRAIGMLGDRATTSHWIAGLSSWRLGDMIQAERHFTALAESRSASGWLQAAGAYWAGRVAERSQPDAAGRWFAMASRYPTTFYGILAMRKLGVDIARWIPPGAPNAGGRAEGLAQRIARPIDNAGARFPIPDWRPQGGFQVDPALVYAVARQESGFDPKALSRSGAAGLMQLMPGTADKMAGGGRIASLFDPATNLELGQRLIGALMRDPNIGENLLLLAVAYNGGSGNAARFRSMMGRDDPLIAIESLPKDGMRDFIQRVLANYWIYKARLGGDTSSLSDLASGRWPLYRWTRGAADGAAR